MNSEHRVEYPPGPEGRENQWPGVPGNPRARTDVPQGRQAHRERTEWRKAQERVMTIVKRRRAKRSDLRPRHGARYRGRLGTLLRELCVMLYRYGSVASSCERAVSAKTSKDRRLVMTQMLVDLYRGKYQLCHLKNFKAKHARAILEHWTAQGIASSTMSTYVSHLRVFLGWLDKLPLLAAIEQYLSEHPGLTQRRAATVRDKSERGANVDFEEIYRRATETGNEHFVCQLLLIAALGLRVREAWLFRPHLSVDSVGRVNVDWGTKGGRPRELPMPPTPLQQSAIDRARALVPNAHGSMIPKGFATMEEWSREFYRLCSRIGLTKNQLGVTPHSLRHGVLLDLYRYLAGVPAPVRGGTETPVQKHKEREVRKIVAEFAGHSRSQVSSAYLGSGRRGNPTKASAESPKHGRSQVPAPEGNGVSDDPSADVGGSDITRL